jgi:very-short-patch-repair endonuclease
MPEILNKLVHRNRRRELRKNQTDAEKKLWNYLCRKQVMNTRFCRQFGIGYYIADFYAQAIRLAIELDGKQHETEEGSEYDAERDDYFNSLNITVLRFKNNDVLINVERVVEVIKENIGKLNPREK